MDKLKNSLAKIAEKTNEIKALQYIQKAMSMMLPITLIGSLFSLLNNMPFDWWKNMLTSTGLGSHFNNVYTCTYGHFSIFVAFCMAYQYCCLNRQRKNAVACGIIAICAFLATCPVGDTSGYIGTTGMLGAMIVGGVSAWIYKTLIEKDITIKLPEGVPPMVAQSFISLIPSLVVIVVFMLINMIFSMVGLSSMQDVIYTALRVPLTVIGANAAGELLLFMYAGLLWFFGIHGGMIVAPIMELVFMEKSMENLAAFNAGLPLPNMFTGGFINGAGLAINLAVIVGSHRKELKEIAKIGIVPYLFSISEPTSYGIPTILNPNFFIPQLLSPILGFVVTHGAQLIGFLGYNNGVSVAWSLPSTVTTFFRYGWQGSVINIILTVLKFFLFLPFVKMNDAALDRADAEATAVANQ